MKAKFTFSYMRTILVKPIWPWATFEIEAQKGKSFVKFTNPFKTSTVWAQVLQNPEDGTCWVNPKSISESCYGAVSHLLAGYLNTLICGVFRFEFPTEPDQVPKAEGPFFVTTHLDTFDLTDQFNYSEEWIINEAQNCAERQVEYLGWSGPVVALRSATPVSKKNGVTTYEFEVWGLE